MINTKPQESNKKSGLNSKQKTKQQVKQKQKQSLKKETNMKPLGNQKNGQKSHELKKYLHHKNLTQAEQQIKDILTNKLLYKEVPLDETIFKSSLILKLKVPKQSYIPRFKKMQLGSILRKYSKTMFRGYQSAYEQLFRQMENCPSQVNRMINNDNQLLIRNICSFKPINEGQTKQKQIQINNSQENMIYKCDQMASGYLDAFTISFNTLIYSLQQYCGFKVVTYMTSDIQKYRRQQKQKRAKQNAQNKQTKQLDDFEKTIEQNAEIDRVIYILLYLPNSNLIKAANKYHIKKQVDYAQIDPFLNDPMDKTKRPWQLQFQGQKPQNFNNQDQIQQKNQQQVQQIQVKNKQKNIRQRKSFAQVNNNLNQKNYYNQNKNRKTVDRKLGFILPNQANTQIINPYKPRKNQIQKYKKFKEEFQQQIRKLISPNYKIPSDGKQKGYNYFNDPSNQDSLTPQEKDYLYIVNRGKVNPGIQKRYVQIKKQRKYVQILKRLSQKYGYPVYNDQPIYAQFKLANKKKNFFSRFDTTMLYKQMIISPYGQLALFNTMQNIKLSYLVLKQHIRIQNFYMLDCMIFALNHDYQKFGRIGSKKNNQVSTNFHYFYEQSDKKVIKSIKGGLNGQNLSQNWHRFLIWKTNFHVLRNYLGQSKAYQIFVKNYIIYLFIFLAPIGIGLQIVKQIQIDPGAAHAGYYPECIFYLLYMALISIVYGIFQQKYRRSQLNFIQNFVQSAPNIQFIHNYEGPYTRDILNDNANTYNQKYITIKDTIKIWLSFLVMFIVLGAQIGLYYGMRQLIVQLSLKIPELNTGGFKFLKVVQLIGYSIYFTVNLLFTKFVLFRLSNFLTKHENRSTKQAFSDSYMLKLFIYCIGVQMIPPIDLLFVQAAANLSCSSEWCALELEAYVYSRYIYLIAFSLFSLLILIIQYCKKSTQKITFNRVQLSFLTRLSSFLTFIHTQSHKQACEDVNLVDQTIVLLHFTTFLTILPLAPAVSLLNMIMNYNMERTQILNSFQRPIPKLETFKPYRKIVTALGHWLLFFNFSRMFITLQWLQYLFSDAVLAILKQPSPYSLMTLRYASILIFMFIYQLIKKATVRIVANHHSVMDKRKLNMYKKHQIHILNAGNTIQLNQPKPINSISRTYNNIIKKRLQKNGSVQNTEEDQFFTQQGQSNLEVGSQQKQQAMKPNNK